MKLKRINEQKEPIIAADLDQTVIIEDEVREEAVKEMEEKEKEDAKVVADLDKASITEGLAEDAYKEAEDIRAAAEEQAQQVIKDAQEQEQAQLDELEELGKINLITSTIKDLIQDEWEAIEGYQEALSVVKANNLDKSLIGLLEEIIEEEMIHVGQLNKAMTLVLPSFNKAQEEGEQEASELMQEENPTDDELDAEIEAELNSELTDDEIVDDEVEGVIPETIEPLSEEEIDEINEMAAEREAEEAAEELGIDTEEDDEPEPVDISEEELNAELAK